MTPTMRSLIVLSFCAVLAACGGGAPPASPDGPTAEASRRIRAMEDSLFAGTTFDRKGAQALLDVYLAFEKANPSDTLAPEYAFRAAGLKKALGDPQGSVALYDRIISNYPHWRRLPDTYYLKAFTIDNDLHQKGEAKAAYEQVIARFPEHRFAVDAQQMIDNLQYTDEELIERFKRMNTDSARASAAK